MRKDAVRIVMPFSPSSVNALSQPSSRRFGAGEQLRQRLRPSSGDTTPVLIRSSMSSFSSRRAASRSRRQNASASSTLVCGMTTANASSRQRATKSLSRTDCSDHPRHGLQQRFGHGVAAALADALEMVDHHDRQRERLLVPLLHGQQHVEDFFQPSPIAHARQHVGCEDRPR